MAHGETPVTKGRLIRFYNGSEVDSYDFLYNPQFVKESVSVKWNLSNAPGQYLPVASFQAFSPTVISFSLFLNCRENGGSAALLENIAKLKLFAQPGSDFSASAPQFVSPGRCKLVLGSRVWNGVINSIGIDYTMFNRDFDPVAASVAVSFTLTSWGLDEEVAHIQGIRSRGGSS